MGWYLTSFATITTNTIYLDLFQSNMRPQTNQENTKKDHKNQTRVYKTHHRNLKTMQHVTNQNSQ